jgi:hypothetical protein
MSSESGMSNDSNKPATASSDSNGPTTTSMLNPKASEFKPGQEMHAGDFWVTEASGHTNLAEVMPSETKKPAHSDPDPGKRGLEQDMAFGDIKKD